MKEFRYDDSCDIMDIYRPSDGELIRLIDENGKSFIVRFEHSTKGCSGCLVNRKGCIKYPIGCDSGIYVQAATMLEDL